MKLKRIVVGSQTKFYPEGVVIVTAAADSEAGAATSTNRPGILDAKWLDIGPCKWSKSPTHKTEEYMEPSPGAYVATDEIVLSKGLKLKGKLEKQSNFAAQLVESCQAFDASPAEGGVYNPLAGSPVVKGWLHIQQYDQDNVLINTVDYWVSLRATGDTNLDDKASETPIEATVLYSPKAVGNLE